METPVRKIPKSAKIRKDLVGAIKDELMYDLSDIGNSIGIIIGKYIKDNKLDKKDFMHGVNHGISLIDGTHSKTVIRRRFKKG